MTNSRQVAESRHHDRELDAVGLPPVDGQVYAMLVGQPRASAVELAEQCGLSAQLVNRALSRLTATGMTSRVPGRPARYLAGAPDVALGTLVARKEAELRSARSAVHRLMEVFREASRFTHPAELVEVVTGTENINNRVAHMQNAARSQIRGFDKPPYLKQPGGNLDAEQQRLSEGIRYRVIYDREAVAWPGRLADDILVSCAQGELARVRPELPMKMILADEQEAIIPISPSLHVVEAAYVIHPSALLDGLSTLFEAEWARAIPLQRAIANGRGRVGGAEPDEETVSLLALLAAGQTDEGIARALGWSARTTQRRVRQLMTDLNATTRFQAGMAAKSRGWRLLARARGRAGAGRCSEVRHRAAVGDAQEARLDDGRLRCGIAAHPTGLVAATQERLQVDGDRAAAHHRGQRAPSGPAPSASGGAVAP